MAFSILSSRFARKATEVLSVAIIARKGRRLMDKREVVRRRCETGLRDSLRGCAAYRSLNSMIQIHFLSVVARASSSEPESSAIQAPVLCLFCTRIAYIGCRSDTRKVIRVHPRVYTAIKVPALWQHIFPKELSAWIGACHGCIRLKFQVERGRKLARYEPIRLLIRRW